jgi:hypothetical protein
MLDVPLYVVSRIVLRAWSIEDSATLLTRLTKFTALPRKRIPAAVRNFEPLIIFKGALLTPLIGSRQHSIFLIAPFKSDR